MATESARTDPHVLLPVLPLRDLCLFPEASLTVMIARPGALRALEIAARSGGRVLALAIREGKGTNPRDVHAVGTVAAVAEDLTLSGGMPRVELDGLGRARAVEPLGSDTLGAEAGVRAEGRPGGGWRAGGG